MKGLLNANVPANLCKPAHAMQCEFDHGIHHIIVDGGRTMVIAANHPFAVAHGAPALVKYLTAAAMDGGARRDDGVNLAIAIAKP